MKIKLSNKIKLECLYCGKTHYKLPCQMKKGRGKYCSRVCKYEASKNKLEISCDHCNKTFKRHPSEMDSKSRFCSIKCYKSQRRSGILPTTYPKKSGRHEHRIVVEKYLGRNLSNKEVVHHIDENKHNNSPENLAVLPNQKIHAKVHYGNYDFEKFKLINIKNGI